MSISTHRPTGTRRPGPGPDRASGSARVGAAGTGRAMVRALTALTGLIVLVMGVPIVLVALGRALPVDAGVLTSLQRTDDGTLLLVVLLALAWLAWAALTSSVALEAWSALRRVPTPRIPGLAAPQRAAAVLVAALTISVTPGGIATSTSAGTGASPDLHSTGSLVARVHASYQTSVAMEEPAGPEVPDADAGAGSRTGGAPASRAPEPDLPTITTRRHDTLWLLAEQHLGDGARFTEIVELNAGVTQPDGRALGPDGRVYPGWVLRLPADADPDAARPDRRRVAAGDTLWAIAEDELGDPLRYPEVFRANAGDLQPDGRRLEDPDLIRPGWVLEIPREAQGDGAAGIAGGVPPEAGPADDDAPARAVDRDDPAAQGPEPADLPDERADSGEGPDLEVPSLDRGASMQGSSGGVADDALPLLDRSTGARPDPVVPDAPRPPAVADQPDPDQPDPDQPDPDQPGDPGEDRAAVAEGAFLVPAGGTLAALLLAGFVRELSRRRRQFQRHRRTGERMPAVADSASLESLARSAAAEDGTDLLEAALAQLAAEAASAGVSLPPVRTVRVSPTCVWLDLAPDGDAPSPLPPFVPHSEHMWQLDPALLSAPDEAEARAFPGLVTLGVRGDEAVLVNLAEVGTLVVEGPPASLPGVLRALASEVVLGPAHGQVAPTFCLGDTHLTEAITAAMEAGDVAVEPDPSRAAAILAAALAGGGSDRAGDPLDVILADRDLGVAAGSQSGAALVTTAPAARSGAALVLDGLGGAELRPDGIALIPQSLAASAVSQLSALLAAADVPAADVPATDVPATDVPAADGPASPAPRLSPVLPEPLASTMDGSGYEAEHEEAPVPLPDPGPGPRAAGSGSGRESDPTAHAAPGRTAPRILVLGEVEVENATGKAESTRVGRLAETAAFVLLHPGSRPSELQSALWPGRRSNPQTCRQMISRTRTWLGRTADGTAYLMPFSDTGGRLRLRDEVGSDWAEFQALAARGLADPADIDDLTAALRLVRGRPFGTVASREVPWADLAINDMIGLITDVAHELASRHERAGRLSEARDAALRGLLTESESEVLEAMVTRLGVRG